MSPKRLGDPGECRGRAVTPRLHVSIAFITAERSKDLLQQTIDFVAKPMILQVILGGFMHGRGEIIHIALRYRRIDPGNRLPARF